MYSLAFDRGHELRQCCLVPDLVLNSNWFPNFPLYRIGGFYRVISRISVITFNMAIRFVREAKTSFLCFLLGAAICFLPSVPLLDPSLQYVWIDFWKYLLGIYALAFNVIISLIFISDNNLYQVVIVTIITTYYFIQ